MPIERIEGLTFGVENLDEAIRFVTDLGLERLDGEAGEGRFRTSENQIVRVRNKDDPRLPPAFQAGATVREVIWGVGDEADLAMIAADLGSAARQDPDMLRTTDPQGLGLGFMKSNRVPAEESVRSYNQNRHIVRVNDSQGPRGAPRPIRIIHVAIDIRKEDNEALLAFYEQKLRFKPVDSLLDTGTFLQSEGDIEHHNFFLCHRPDSRGINHFAMEVFDFDAVIESGNYMIEQGWKESRRMGRHKVGSNIFRFIHSPLGGRIEFVADMDRMDKSWEPRVFEKNPGHHIWMMKSTPEPAGGGRE
jgi:hypothetical protein